MRISDLLRSMLKKGLRIGYSSGRAFDPRDQERTDAIKDLMKGNERRQKDGDTKVGS